jgi:hypothetical protein
MCPAASREGHAAPDFLNDGYSQCKQAVQVIHAESD